MYIYTGCIINHHLDLHFWMPRYVAIGMAEIAANGAMRMMTNPYPMMRAVCFAPDADRIPSARDFALRRRVNCEGEGV